MNLNPKNQKNTLNSNSSVLKKNESLIDCDTLLQNYL